jgi:predicted transcriptional regulator
MTAPRRKPGQLAQALLSELATAECQKTAELAQILNAPKRKVSDAAGVLIGRGLITRPVIGTYRITEEGRRAHEAGVTISTGPKGPHGTIPVHRDTFRERVWRSIRIRRRFTIGDVVSDATRDTEKDPRANAARYIRMLRYAGYLRELPRRQQGSAPTSNGFKVFALVRDTGPRAPVWRKTQRVLHDFNLGEDIPCTSH